MGRKTTKTLNASNRTEMRESQRPLVLTYDEESESISSKFAADWTEPGKPRFYF